MVITETKPHYKAYRHGRPVWVRKYSEVPIEEDNRLLKCKPQTTNKYDYGYIYFIRCGEFYKIGYASNVKSRLSSLQSANPINVYCISCIRVRKPKKVEKELHEKYSCSRSRGEWFQFEDYEVDKISSYLNSINN